MATTKCDDLTFKKWQKLLTCIFDQFILAILIRYPDVRILIKKSWYVELGSLRVRGFSL